MNISLPEQLRSFVDDQVAEHGFRTSSEYIHALIQKERDRQDMRNLLLAGAASPPTTPADDAYFDAVRARILSRKAG